jgi:hypothetical protein
MKTPYLIQRATIVSSRKDDFRVSEAMDLDYMGSSEFEFGATAKSLRGLETAFLNNRAEDGDSLRISDVSEISVKSRSGKDKPLKVLHCMTDEEFTEYLPYLHNMRDGKLHTKESTGFESNPRWPAAYTNINFWWDIENHVMWSFDHDLMRKLPLYLQNSWKYMNEKALPIFSLT